MRCLKTDRTASVVIQGHAFIRGTVNGRFDSLNGRAFG